MTNLMTKFTIFTLIVLILYAPSICSADAFDDAKREFIRNLYRDSIEFQNIVSHCTSSGMKRMQHNYDHYLSGEMEKIGRDLMQNCPRHILKLKKSSLSEDDANYLSLFSALGRKKTKGIGILAKDMGEYWQLYTCSSGGFWKSDDCVVIKNNDMSFIRNYIYLDSFW